MPFDIPLPELVLIVVAATVSGVVSGYAGFGGGLLLVPIMVWIVTPVDAAFMAALSSSVSLVFLVPSASKSATWREVLPMIVALVVTVWLGVIFLVSADPVVIRRSMGAFVVCAALVLMSGWRYRGSRGIGASLVVGGLAGGVTGAFGIPGTPFNATYFLSAPTSARVQRANIVTTNAALATAFLIGLLLAGVFNYALAVKTLLVLGVWMIASRFGKRLFERAPVTWFRKVTLGLLMATGLCALLL